MIRNRRAPFILPFLALVTFHGAAAAAEAPAQGAAPAVPVGAVKAQRRDVRGSLAGVGLPRTRAGVPSGLLARRPDVQAAEARLAAVNADLKGAEAARFPSVILTAQGGTGSTHLSDLVTPAGVFYTVAAGAVQPIFEGGRLEGAVELQKGRWDEQVQNYRKAAATAFKDVEDALTAVEQTAREVEAQTTAAETAQRAYDITQARLFSGTIDILTLLNTQRTLFQAQDLLIQDKLALLQATVGLFRALGGGWQAGAAP